MLKINQNVNDIKCSIIAKDGGFKFIEEPYTSEIN